MRALLAALGANTCVSCTTAGADCLDDRLCGECARALPTSPSAQPAPEACTEAWAWGDYAGAVGELVRVAKYRPDEGLARVLVGAASLRSGTPVGYDAIVPVPAGRWRTWRRGFSLPSLLAERLADAGSTPVRRCLARGDASAQAGVSRSARRSHAAGVWSVRGPARGNVLLVDDVLTSGATVSACAAALLGAGAARVDVFVLAAAHRPQPRG